MATGLPLIDAAGDMVAGWEQNIATLATNVKAGA
jgi:hypothetical protein